MTSTPLTLDDYDAIAAAVMETERGRWFLAEFARRNRAADTAAILDALAAVETRLAERPRRGPPGSPKLVARLLSIAEEAVRLREALGALPKQGRNVIRALRRCDEIEKTLGLALADLGVAPRPRPERLAAPVATGAPAESAPAASAYEAEINAVGPAEPEAVRPLGVAEAPAAVQPIESLDDVFAAKLAAELFALDAAAEPAAEEQRPEPIAIGGAGAAQADEDRVAATEIAAIPEPANGHDAVEEAPPSPAPVANGRNGHPAPQLRPSLPRAWTPGLLEGLTPEERAILFA